MKDLFDLFRESEHKLQEMPSERTWRRLERRLDARRHRRGRSQFLPLLGMVAGLLLLLTIYGLFSLSSEPDYREVLAGTPERLEALPVSEDFPSAHQIQEYVRTYHERAGQPILEGKPEQKLVVRKL